MDFNHFLQNNLNPEQKKAVSQKDGPLLVIAGAGSGKTRVITSRIINLMLNEQVPPHAIIALTFTNKAALEMKERIVHFLGATAPKPFIGTFHSYCLYLMRTHLHYMPFTNFTIMDGDDQQQLLQSLIKKKWFTKKNICKEFGLSNLYKEK